jgi:P27 family predicted phage terminase small subunit
MAGTKGHSGGKNKKSIAELKRAGTYRPGRHGHREGPVLTVIAGAVPDVPAHLTGEAAAFWRELAPLLHRAKLLTSLDLPRLELLCVHFGHHRQLYVKLTEILAKQDGGGPAVDTSRITRAMRQEADTIRALSAGFGLDPADRDRLHVPPSANNPWAAIGAPTQSRWAGVLP